MTLIPKYIDPNGVNGKRDALIEASNNDTLGRNSPSVNQLTEKYGISIDAFMEILMKGINVEFEHTNNIFVASEIARDHLNEDLEYYTKLEKVEEGH